ncbi:NUDIX domain-containing protein [Candidatus Giovannonibacteria bacterium]|nr:NUDIX domain-containing protein [Candidatus Giovannonibacteria bacterium]
MPHIHEKIDLTVEVFIVHKNKVLLRKHDKYEIWLSVGGHIELDEDPNQAAIREVKEEVGLDIELIDYRDFIFEDERFKELIPPVALNRHRISDAHEHVTMVYYAKTNSDKIIPEKDTDEWKWCEKDDIEKLDNTPKDVVYHAKRALAQIT